MDWIITNYAEIISGILQVIGGASIIVRLTPTTTDDNILAWVQKTLSFVALNKK